MTTQGSDQQKTDFNSPPTQTPGAEDPPSMPSPAKQGTDGLAIKASLLMMLIGLCITLALFRDVFLAIRYWDGMPDQLTAAQLSDGAVENGQFITVTGYHTSKYQVDFRVVKKKSNNNTAHGYLYSILIPEDDPSVAKWKELSAAVERLLAIKSEEVMSASFGEGARFASLLDEINALIPEVKPECYFAVAEDLGAVHPPTGVSSIDYPREPIPMPTMFPTGNLPFNSKSVDEIIEANQQKVRDEQTRIKESLDAGGYRQETLTGIVRDMPMKVRRGFSSFGLSDPVQYIALDKRPDRMTVLYALGGIALILLGVALLPGALRAYKG